MAINCCISFFAISLKKPHVAVIGAGFGGWGAAKALCENGCRVTLIDMLSDPTGATPYLTPTGIDDYSFFFSDRGLLLIAYSLGEAMKASLSKALDATLPIYLL